MVRRPISPFIASATCLLTATSFAQDFSPRIIDGSTATNNDWPYITALVTKGASAYDGQFCGGSYIGDRYILTAAHCVENVSKDDFDVIVGINNLNNESNEGVRLGVQQFYIHPRYDSDSLENDIAIIELPRVLTTNEAIPVQLVDANTRTATPVGTTMTVAGWGSTTPDYGNHTTSAQLLEVTVPLVAQTACANAFSGVSSDIDSENFCAGYSYEGYDSCRGDSGGPLVLDNSGTQLGIVSFGSLRCGDASSYGVYTNISKYVEWIDQITAGLSYSQNSFAGYKGLGANTHDFTFTNRSSNVVTYSNALTSYGDTSITENSCATKGSLNEGESCVVRVRFSAIDFGLVNVGIRFDYQQSGQSYSIYPDARYEIAIPASSALSDVFSLENVTVYTNDNPWQVESDGIRSAPIPHNERSAVIFDGLPAGDYNLAIRVSSESADQLSLYVNGVYYGGAGGQFTDEIQVYLPAASNRIKFEYQKDASVDEGEDVVYITDFRSVANPTTTSGLKRSGGGGGSLGWLSLFVLLPLLRRKK